MKLFALIVLSVVISGSVAAPAPGADDEVKIVRYVNDQRDDNGYLFT